MDFKKKLINLWYYYKFYLLFIVIALMALAVGINSCVNKQEYDVNILFATHGYSDSFFQTGELVTLFDKYAEDTNEDGVANTQFITINYGLTLQDSNNANATRSANLASGKAVLFLLDEQNYKELKSGGFLEDISSLGTSDYLKDDCFEIYDSGMLDNVSGFSKLDDPYYLCLRTFDKKKAESDKGFAMRYEAAKSLLINVIKSY